METVTNHILIKVTPEDVKKAREFYGLNDINRIQESLDIIEEWCQKQDHLVAACKYLGRNMLERVFILAKGSIEGTKTRLDKFLTTRGLMPELSLKRTTTEFEKFWDCINYIPLPVLCHKDQSRVMITQFLNNKLDDFNLLTYFRYCFMIGEYRLQFDYSLSERYIIDLTNVHIGHLSKINPVVVKKSEILCSEGFGTKIKGIHILNAPPFVDRLVFLLKQALREKVASRIHVHSTYEDLHKHVPKDILPKDYGGNEQSCEKLAGQWRHLLKTAEAVKIVEDLDKLISDESRRSSSKFCDEYMGMPGSFRKLNVD